MVSATLPTPPSRSSSSRSAIGLAQNEGKLTDTDAQALTQKLQSLSIDVNPRYGTFNPQTAAVELTHAGLGQAAPHRLRTRAVTAGRLALVVTSPRVAPGLLSHGAWAAVAAATVRLTRSLDEPVAEAVDESGFARRGGR